MSQDYKNNKQNPTGLYPGKVSKLTGEGAAGFTRVEPWMTPERLRQEYLFGIPLVSPITKERLTDDTLKVFIRKAAAQVELKIKVDVSPIQRFQRLEFDRVKYLQGWNQLQLEFGNISSIQEVAIRATNSNSPPIIQILGAPVGLVRLGNVVTVSCGNLHNLLVNNQITISGALDSSFNGTFSVTSTPTSSVFTFDQVGPDASSGNGLVSGLGDEGSLLYSVPLDWIDMSQCSKGLLHFVPLQTTFGSYGVVGPSAGAAAPLFAIFSQLQWIPSFWAVKYTCGFDENSIPVPINDLIGCYAALHALSLLGPLNRFNSQSISLDGSSQSVSGPGPQLYVQRMQDLQAKIQDLEDLLAKRFGKKFFMSHI